MTQFAIPPDSSRSDHWETLFDAVPFPIYVVDVETRELVAVNRVMHARTGAKAGDTCHQAIYRQDRQCLFCPIAKLNANPAPMGSCIVFENFNNLDGRWYQLEETLLPWPGGRIVKHSIAVDISELKETRNALTMMHGELSMKNKELERLSVTDKLTGLLNRHKLDQLLLQESQRAARYEQPLSMIVIDMDHFKSVNDTFGNQAGDDVLAGVAKLLGDSVRNVDIVGRWGEDEFMILCPNTPLNGTINVANKLRGLIEQCMFPVVGRKTASFGVAELRTDETPAGLLARADAALYRAKAKGGNRVDTGEEPEGVMGSVLGA
jgi:diguanylate cyclase (GGDEF)-like protein